MEIGNIARVKKVKTNSKSKKKNIKAKQAALYKARTSVKSGLQEQFPRLHVQEQVHH